MSGTPTRPHGATFEAFLVAAVDDALALTFDASTAKAVRFYIDTNILAKNPEAYADSVMRMFGERGGQLVLDSIKKNLGQKAGMAEEVKNWSTMRKCVEAVAKRYRSR